jgi:uncharacterized membrane protein YvbJ
MLFYGHVSDRGENLKKCPICGNEEEDDADICSVCGFDFVNEESYDAIADEQDEEEEDN